MTKKGPDQGVDMIITYRDDNIAVQVKRKKNKIGNKAVQEVTSGKIYYQCNRAWVVTNNYFTKSAEDLARSCDVELVDRNKLNEFIN